MKSELKKLHNNQIKATVELSQEDLQSYVNEAEDMLGGEADIKGFRRGKAPKDMVRKHVGQERIRALALEIAVDKSLADVVKDNSLDVMETSQLTVENNDIARLKYSVVLDLFPRVELADLSRVKVKRR